MRSSLLVVTLLFSLFACNSSDPTPVKAPDFTLKDGVHQQYSLSDYKGRPVIVIFWATWCPYCGKLMPGLEKFYQFYKDEGLEVIAIDIMDKNGDPIAHMKERGFSFRLGLDGDKVAKQWRVKSTPTTFFINRKGEIIARTRISNPDSDRLEQLVTRLMAPPANKS